ncbi:MAG: oxidoreductase [Myxococcota bacterium]
MVLGREGWTPDRVPDLTGKTYLITGANSGIGYETSRILARRGARLLWLCRDPAKAKVKADELRAEVPAVALTTFGADLADLDTVRVAATEVCAATDRLDAVINNAGIMMVPRRESTEQGFELQLGVNHFAHFALDAWLYDRVAAAGGRYVAVSSGAHKGGRMDFDDPNWERGYSPVPAYCRSKLANLLFAREANRRLERAGSPVRVLTAHPGYSATNLQTTGPGAVWGAVMSFTNRWIAQSAERGAWPSVLAACDPEARPGVYYGPTRAFEAMGPVGECTRAAAADDDAAARALWELSERSTGVPWLD